MTVEEALLRINAGKDDNYYIERADYVIYNNGDECEFLHKITKILEEILFDR